MILPSILLSAWLSVVGAVEPNSSPQAPNVLNFTMNKIDGTPTPLNAYAGKVVLIVNVASKCGFTKQYAGLEQLFRDHKDAGFTILAFPANNFGGQEPGSNEEIAEFCSSTYDVTFDIFEKISVAGSDQAPLYAFLTSADTNPQFAGPIGWNFEKFLVSREGKVVARFKSRVAPDSAELVDAVKAELAK
jgi:glutathione peroxidase